MLDSGSMVECRQVDSLGPHGNMFFAESWHGRGGCEAFMKLLLHGAPDVSMTIWQLNNVPFSRSLVARARYSSSRASSADFEEAFGEVLAELGVGLRLVLLTLR